MWNGFCPIFIVALQQKSRDVKETCSKTHHLRCSKKQNKTKNNNNTPAEWWSVGGIGEGWLARRVKNQGGAGKADNQGRAEGHMKPQSR